MKEKERALAHIEKIAWIKPIEGADNIELIGVLGWNLIAKKGEFSVGDKTVFFEIDSKLPVTEWSQFMESKHYKVKTMKLGKFNVISQGLALPIDVFKNEKYYEKLKTSSVGDNVTDMIGITYSSLEDVQRKRKHGDPDAKYKTMASRYPKLAKKKWFRKMIKNKIGKRILFFLFGKKKDKPKSFPSWIIKTDETRIENAPFYLESDEAFIKTEKIDGTSTTVFIDYVKSKKGDFGVCSRNVRQLDAEQKCYHICGNVYWEMVDKYDMENVIRDLANKYNAKRVVIQGETYGESLQGNPYKLNERRFAAFNLIFDGNRLGSVEAKNILEEYGIPFVPIIDTEYHTPNNMENMKLEADGYSEINNKVKREGFVYRSLDGKTSFKNVSREYLLKHNG